MTVELSIPVGEATVAGDLQLPESPYGIVVFAHGSGSSRRSPRNRMVAERLQSRRFGTLLADLLSPEEEDADRLTGQLRFDIGLLAERLVAMIDTLGRRWDTERLPMGLFGASTGAAAALIAAANRPEVVRAVVSRGGRPDLAAGVLGTVTAPTLLIVGGADTHVLTLNRTAATAIRAVCRVHVVPGATHLFEEPGALDEVAEQAAEWFGTYLPAVASDDTVLDGYPVGDDDTTT
ncbi:MAG: dienelactone hydrolase family protein [Micromonosporaceae bacterium]